jgi:hypothetical protein
MVGLRYWQFFFDSRGSRRMGCRAGDWMRFSVESLDEIIARYYYRWFGGGHMDGLDHQKVRPRRTVAKPRGSPRADRTIKTAVPNRPVSAELPIAPVRMRVPPECHPSESPPTTDIADGREPCGKSTAIVTRSAPLLRERRRPPSCMRDIFPSAITARPQQGDRCW